jgi:hypothetical protein
MGGKSDGGGGSVARARPGCPIRSGGSLAMATETEEGVKPQPEQQSWPWSPSEGAEFDFSTGKLAGRV